MNCDTVFATLTRGPFPTGCASDAEVERHLARCESCRAIAAALAPHDDQPTRASRRRLPCYRGAAVTQAVALSTRASADTSPWPVSLATDEAGDAADWPIGFQLANVTLPRRNSPSRVRFFRVVGASAAAAAVWAIIAALA